MKKRVLALIALVAATTGAAITAFALEINPPMTNVIGSYGSILAALIAAKIFKVSDGLYYAGLLSYFLLRRWDQLWICIDLSALMTKLSTFLAAFCWLPWA